MLNKYSSLKFVSILFAFFYSNQSFTQDYEEIKDTTKYETQDVVVVGTRSTEKIIDIPYSVFRVDKKELSYGKKTSARDVLADVPGLFLQNRFGTTDLRISIRGFGTRSNSGVRGVKILQDGIPESEPDGESVIDAIDLTSLGGVEVVKGNLSTLYSNAPGGVINFISDIYFPKNYIGSFNQAAKFGYRQNGIKLGLKNNDNRLFLSYNYRNFDGFRQHSRESQHLVNSIYQAFVGTNSTVSLHTNFVNSVSFLPGSLTIEEWYNDPFSADPIAISQNIRKTTKKGRVAGRFITNFGSLQQNELELTGYIGIKELEKIDNEFYSFNTRYSLGGIVRFSNRSEIFNHKNIFTVGMDYAFQSGPITQFDNIAGNKGLDVKNQYNESLSNIGFYFMNHFTVIENSLDLFLSGRFDDNLYSRNIYIPYGFVDTSRNMNGFVPKVGLNYKLTPQIALYSSYGISYDYPALVEMANSPLTSNLSYAINPDLKPQKSNNFELGIKGNIKNEDNEFMKKIVFDVTYFNYLIQDEIIPYVINLKSYFRNAAQTRRTGIEIGFMSEPFEEIEWVVNYTYTNFYYENYEAEIFYPGGSVIENYTNNKVPSVPRHIVNFILVKELELTEEITGLLIWDCDYISGMFVNDKNSERTGDYFYGNIMAGLTFDYEKYSITTFTGIHNIFDRRYVSFININDFNGRFYETGEPRNIYAGLNLSYKF
ncbi:Outer membrane receptor protein [Ignavibacterium album JCM 16511]|uniref:Outer membrane receptor protein n=1 Tax=Ignavibacterium album (strain DSM 19864 / JCM 16511 / NBRC 101810 / Mat9-16) TaxID=945713 RepID=I0AKI7_IGNAJ|nr:TonB-dependent receptor [Ignavibacterium album]AFH49494.1 Outer membrane receptor protein [Ignavibacterium album JCM 16511]